MHICMIGTIVYFVHQLKFPLKTNAYVLQFIKMNPFPYKHAW